jgi:hypothetical protein
MHNVQGQRSPLPDVVMHHKYKQLTNFMVKLDLFCHYKRLRLSFLKGVKKLHSFVFVYDIVGFR